MKRTTLIVMRLADMTRVHPDQIIEKCSRCGHDVGVYPSGQRVMKLYPGGIDLVCSVCKPPEGRVELAPGALAEPAQSKRKQ
jgi:hypothetical protein